MSVLKDPRLRWLFIGSREDARNLEWLKANNIRYILNCTDEPGNGGVPNYFSKDSSLFDYCRLPLSDNDSELLAHHYQKCWEFFNRCLIREDGCMLVHCKLGISRSASCLISFLIKFMRMSYSQALDLLVVSRRDVRPKSRFQQQLRELSEKLENNPSDYWILPFRNEADSLLLSGNFITAFGKNRSKIGPMRPRLPINPIIGPAMRPDCCSQQVIQYRDCSTNENKGALVSSLDENTSFRTFLGTTPNLSVLNKYGAVMIGSNLRSMYYSLFQVRSFASCSHTTDPKEVAFYNNHASKWWDSNGQFSPLLHFNSVRIPFIERQVQRTGMQQFESSILKGLRILDVGCGGGFLSEALAEKGAEVVGIDVAEQSIKVAIAHCNSRLSMLVPKSNLYTSLQRLKYLHTDIETLTQMIHFPLPEATTTVKTRLRDSASIRTEQHGNEDTNTSPPPHASSSHATPLEPFDVVVASEVIEHVNHVESFFSQCADCVRPGGLLIITTPNRTPLSYFVVIFLAEYIFRLIPHNTHSYSKFVTPADVQRLAEHHQFEHLETVGTLYLPLIRRWFLEPTGWVTYMTAYRKKMQPLRKQETSYSSHESGSFKSMEDVVQ